MFNGNSDSHSLRHSYLVHPVQARFVRVHIVDWFKHPALRLELIGCQGTKTEPQILLGRLFLMLNNSDLVSKKSIHETWDLIKSVHCQLLFAILGNNLSSFPHIIELTCLHGVYNVSKSFNDAFQTAPRIESLIGKKSFMGG